MRRLLLCAALAAFCAAPSAQVSVLPLAGYDIDTQGPTLGLGAEVLLSAPRRPYSLSVRPSAEYVFAPDQPIVTIAALPPGAPNTIGVGVLRGGADLVGRLALSGTSLIPYAKAGVVAERTAYRVPNGGGRAETNLGAAVGLGVEARGVFVEGTLGTAAVSTSRVALGVRF